jgi:uncharacterized membrane protein
MVHFGFLLLPLVLLIHARLIGHVRRLPETPRGRRTVFLGLSYLVSLYVFLFAQRYFLLFFLAAMIGYAIMLAALELRQKPKNRSSRDAQDRRVFVAVCGLSIAALFLSLFAEVWVVDDGYEGAFERYNTVFKLYNVIWLLYGIGFAASVFVYLPRLTGEAPAPITLHNTWPWAALAAIVLMGLAYPIAATNARLNEHRKRARTRQRVALPPGSAFDAVRYYASVDRDEYALVEWTEQNIDGKPIVAEGCRTDDAYTVQSRIATFTGVRTLLAWPKHEANWRSHVPPRNGEDEPIPIWTELARRIRHLEMLYTGNDPAVIRRIVDLYGIDYILIGRWEYALYGPAAGQAVRKIYKPAFARGDTILLRTGGPRQGL